MKDLTIAPGHRYVNEFYQQHQPKSNDFVLLGQHAEFDLYGIRQHNQWSVGARWAHAGPEYQADSFNRILPDINTNLLNKTQYEVPALAIAAIRLYAFLENADGWNASSYLELSLTQRFSDGNSGVWGLKYSGYMHASNALRFALEDPVNRNFIPLGHMVKKGVDLYMLEQTGWTPITGYVGAAPESLNLEITKEVMYRHSAGFHKNFKPFQFKTPINLAKVPIGLRYENNHYVTCKAESALQKFAIIGQWDEFDLYAVWLLIDGKYRAWIPCAINDQHEQSEGIDLASANMTNKDLVDFVHESRMNEAIHRCFDHPWFGALASGKDMLNCVIDPNYRYKCPVSTIEPLSDEEMLNIHISTDLNGNQQRIIVDILHRPGKYEQEFTLKDQCEGGAKYRLILERIY